MSYTILTVPFDLIEKTEGDYLKKGFVFNDLFPEIFESDSSGSSGSFLHVAEFNSAKIKMAALKTYFNLNFPDVNVISDSSDVFKSTSFFDTKHLNSTHGFIREIEYNKLNGKLKHQNNDNENNDLKLPLDKLSLQYRYSSDQIKTGKSNEVKFEIDGVKIYFNQSKTSKNGIGFGFIEIILKWEFNNAFEMIESLEPFSELFRFYGNDNKNEFHIFNKGDWNCQVEDYIAGRKKKS